jgi:hypothetical protein
MNSLFSEIVYPHNQLLLSLQRQNCAYTFWPCLALPASLLLLALRFDLSPGSQPRLNLLPPGDVGSRAKVGEKLPYFRSYIWWIAHRVKYCELLASGERSTPFAAHDRGHCQMN